MVVVPYQDGRLGEKGKEANEQEDSGEGVGECNALEFEAVRSDCRKVCMLKWGE
jgi:hypothetical protein